METGVGASLDITRDGEILYKYHQLHMTPNRKVDAVFCLCSLDTRGSGKLTEDRFNKPEAEVFADIALQMGVPEDKLIVETLSTNTGENVRFTYALLQKKGLVLRSLLLVQKPYMERRTFATFKKQWPDPNAEILVTSPQLTWEEYPNTENPRDLVLNIAVGDLIRIKEYPAKGFQIPQDIPEHVWQAAQRLILAGYHTHLP